MWLLPTRGRPDDCRALIRSMIECGDCPAVAVMIDDEPAVYAGVPWPGHWHVHVAPEQQHLELTAAANRLVDLHPGQAFYGLISDRTRFVMPWSKDVSAAAGDLCIAYTSDGWLDGRQANRPWLPAPTGIAAAGGELVRRLGWLLLPTTMHLYVDYALAALGDRFGLLRHLPEIAVAVDRPDTTGRAADANYRRQHRGADYAEADAEAYATFVSEISSYDERLGLDVIDPPVVVACTKGPGDAAEKVNILLDMVRRALPEGFAFRFACLTEEPEGLDPAIERIFATDREEAFAPGHRIIFLDLNMAISGPLDRLVAYRGPPAGFGGKVALWRAGDRVDDALDLDAVMPGAVQIYRETMTEAPADAAVVLFEGKPAEGWPAEVCKIGGLIRAEINAGANTPDHVMFANVRATMARPGIRQLRLQEAHGRSVLICGSGPSLLDTLPDIAGRLRAGAALAVLNNSGAILHDKAGFVADWQVILDARPENARFIGPWARAFLISSTCAAAIFDRAEAAGPVVAYHPVIRNIEVHIPDEMKPVDLVGGGITVGLTAMAAFYILGFRDFHLFGYDSSMRGEETHAAPQERTAAEARRIDVVAAGRPFVTTPAMLKQAEAFGGFAQAMAALDCTITVHGDGLLPHIAREMSRRIAAAEAA